MHDEAVRCLAIMALRRAQLKVAIQPSHLPFRMIVGRTNAALQAMIGTAVARGVAMRLMGLDTIRHLGNPPTRGWFTQEDLLARWYEVGCDDEDDDFFGDSNIDQFVQGAGR